MPTSPQHTSHDAPDDPQARLERLALASPLYGAMLAHDPALAAWLEKTADRPGRPRISMREEWLAHLAAPAAPAPPATPAQSAPSPAPPQSPASAFSLSLLRRWRRRMMLRIAYRSVNELATERETVADLTRLAEFCLREITDRALALWRARRGEPWDDDLGKPARFGVIALGKMGGEELNFSSDIDLIYIYEGDGQCRRDGRATDFSSIEFFTKVGDTITEELSAQTADGFLFRVDTRLRPEGDAGPRARSVLSVENYYATAGQTWERLAWLKARPVAGDIALGAELIETLQPFRYPRHPPPSLLAEIAAMKERRETWRGGVSIAAPPGSRTITAEEEAFNVKVGRGGIREIEFIAQTLQLLHAGRFPFLQTHSTQTALEQLANYDLFPGADVKFLTGAYWFLRRVEHRVQMREEKQTHMLPSDPGELASIARSLGFADAAAFQQKLDATRRGVRALYEEFFEPRARDAELENWWAFFTTPQIPEAIDERLNSWIPGRAKPPAEPMREPDTPCSGTAQPEASPYPESPDLAAALRILVCGDASHIITREQVTQFRHLAETLDTLVPALARPALAFRRLARFAGRYGSRNQFLGTCAGNPHFLRGLALLFDRSAHAVDLLCAHPEIFEEVMRSGELRQHKNRAALTAEINAGPGNAAEFARWLALYVRAEQLRYTIAGLFGFLNAVEIETALSLLADAAVERALARLPGGGDLLVIALGKYGGAELTFGSDLDLMFAAAPSADAQLAALESTARRMIKILRGDEPAEEGSPALAVDARLRPHGEAGPLVVTMDALRAYHEGTAAGPAAQLWERQMLTRARCVCGPQKLRDEFEKWRAALLYGAPVSDGALAEIRAMRVRIERERSHAEPRERAFKTCAGGLVDFEFFAQAMQLRHGWRHESLRRSSTRAVLRGLRALGLIDPEAARELADNYDFLKRIEITLRRDENRAVSVLPEPGDALEPLARWLGYAPGGAAEFWTEHTRRLARTRALLVDTAQRVL